MPEREECEIGAGQPGRLVQPTTSSYRGAEDQAGMEVQGGRGCNCKSVLCATAPDHCARIPSPLAARRSLVVLHPALTALSEIGLSRNFPIAIHRCTLQTLLTHSYPAVRSGRSTTIKLTLCMGHAHKSSSSERSDDVCSHVGTSHEVPPHSTVFAARPPGPPSA